MKAFSNIIHGLFFWSNAWFVFTLGYIGIVFGVTVKFVDPQNQLFVFTLWIVVYLIIWAIARWVDLAAHPDPDD